MYRKFWLVNGNDEKYQLTSKTKKVFANSPSGLGFSNTFTFQRVGNENITSYSLIDMKNISFELLFLQDTNEAIYQEYKTFTKYLSYEPIYLHYQTPDTTESYRRKVKVLQVDKSEISSSDGALHCNVTLSPLDFWENGTSKVIDSSTFAPAAVKQYPLERPYQYGSVSLDDIQIICSGLLETPIAFTIDGEVTDPIVRLYDDFDELYGICKFNGTFDYVYVNSDTSDESIILKANGEIIADSYSYQDLSVGSPSEVEVTFLKLKAGTSHLAFDLGTSDATVKIEWRDRYATV